MGQDLKTEIMGEVIAVTKLAVLLGVGDYKVWLPKSQIETEFSFDIGQNIEIEIPEWLAIDKGLV